MIRIIGAFLAAVFLAGTSLAQTGYIDSATQLLRTACASGTADLSGLRISYSVGTGATISGLNGSSLRVSQTQLRGSVEGAVAYIDEELRALVETDIRECMVRVLPDVLELVTEYSAGFQLRCDQGWGNPDTSSCSGAEFAATSNLTAPNCAAWLERQGAMCGIWQRGPGNCYANEGDLRQGCPGCSAGVTYATQCRWVRYP